MSLLPTSEKHDASTTFPRDISFPRNLSMQQENCSYMLTGHCSMLQSTQEAAYQNYDPSKPHYLQDENQCEAFSRCVTREKGTTKKIIVVSSHTYLKPWLIDVQKRSLENFMKEPYEYLVYGSNLDNPEDEEKLSAHARNLDMNLRRIPSGIHQDRRCLYPNTLEPFVNNPTTRTTDVLMYMLRDARNFCSSDYLLFLDADCFLVSDFYLSDYLPDDNNLAAIKQGRSFSSLGIRVDITYFWTPVLLFDLEKTTDKNAINFDCGSFDLHLQSTILSKFESGLALDASGRSFEWLMKASPKVNWLREIHDHPAILQELGIHVPDVQERLKHSQILCSGNCQAGRFLHIRDASGWMSTTDTVDQQIEANAITYEALMQALDRAHLSGQKAKQGT